MKTFLVTMHFPQVVAHRAYQKTIVDASNIGQAAKRAFDEIRKVDGIKGKRLGIAKIVVTEVPE